MLTTAKHPGLQTVQLIIPYFSQISIIYMHGVNKTSWGFNVRKGKLTHITKRKTPIHSDVHLNNDILELTSEFRDLGLVTKCSLSWSTPIDKISNKVNKSLGLGDL